MTCPVFFNLKLMTMHETEIYSDDFSMSRRLNGCCDIRIITGSGIQGSCARSNINPLAYKPKHGNNSQEDGNLTPNRPQASRNQW